MKVFEDMIEQKLLNLHTCFIGKVVSVSGNYADIQPLNLIKAVGGTPKRQAMLKNVPVSQNARKFDTKQITVSGQTITIPSVTRIATGDTVICLCAERDITEVKTGNFSLPSLGHHSISDALVIGII